METIKDIKKVIILAGGSDQVALMEELRKQTPFIELILIDYTFPVRATEYADRHIIISTMDFDAVEKVARDENVYLILTACGDQPLLTMAVVSERIGLPCYLTKDQVLNLTNKYYMKQMMIKNNIPTSKYKSFNRASSINVSELEYPLVVKPVDSNGSKGVKKVTTKSQLETYVAEAFEYSISSQVIVEEFKEGEEFSVDAYIENGEAKILSITSSSKMKNVDSFTITQSCYPVLDQAHNGKILYIAQQIASVFGLINSPLLMQMINNKGNFSVIEFSARMGGGSKYKLIEVLSGINIMEKYVQLVLGHETTISALSSKVNYARLNYIYCHNGTYNKLENFEELKQELIIHEYFVYKMPNTIINKSDTSSDRVAGYLIIADTVDELINKQFFVNNSLRVIDDKGQDIMNHNITLD